MGAAMLRSAFPGGCKQIRLLLGLAILIGGICWWQRPPPDPVHDGKHLSAFLIPVPQRKGGGGEPTTEQLEPFGPAGVAWLAYTLEHGKTAFLKRGALPLDTAPDWLRRWFPERWGGLRRAPLNDERVRAAILLSVLGPRAAPAIPELVRSLESVDDLLVADAAFALHAIGPASWPVVEGILDHGSVPTRAALLEAMSARFEPPGREPAEADWTRALESLVKAMRDPNPKVRIAAAHCFSYCRRNRSTDARYDSAMPLLIELLSDRDASVSTAAAGGLLSFRTRAAPAIPRLIEMLGDENWHRRYWAIRALGFIDRAEKRSAPRLRILLLQDPKAECRIAAGDVLKLLGPAADDQSTGGADSPPQ